MMLHVFNSLGGDRHSNRKPLTAENLVQIVALALMVQPVIGSEQKSGVGSGGASLSQQIVDRTHVLLRFLRTGSPHVHWVVRGVNVQTADLWPVLEDVNGCAHEPVIDLATIDWWSCA